MTWQDDAARDLTSLGGRLALLERGEGSWVWDADGNKYLYTTFTKEQLEAAPAYDEGTYANQRDNQRIIMQ